MAHLRPVVCADLFKFDKINLDPLTETYGMSFYLKYLTRWGDFFWLAEAPDKQIMGYIMGKAEGREYDWHGHVTALSVAPEYRSMGLAGLLMQKLEDNSEEKGCYYVDLFVRASNKAAIKMYEHLGYVTYRTVTDYYSGTTAEDALDMRKSLTRDPGKLAMQPLDKSVVSPAELQDDW